MVKSTAKNENGKKKMPKKNCGKKEEHDNGAIVVRRVSKRKSRRWSKLFETFEEEQKDVAERVALLAQLLE
jgi:hypothetical protein